MGPLEKITPIMQTALKTAGRAEGSLKLIAVSKKQPLEKIIVLWQAGQRDFGENYVQEWQTKAQALAKHPLAKTAPIRWHFIGHLQSNKVKELIGQVDCIHSVGSFKLAQKISQIAAAKKLTQKILLQVNLGNEVSKSGFSAAELLKQLANLAGLSHLEICGLMAIPPVSSDTKTTRSYFKDLKSLLKQCNQQNVLQKDLHELSMGMSQDFGVAIEEGATMIRLGTLLFGPRTT